MKVHGRCHCGAVTFEADADPARTTVCHCTDCQTITGTAFRTSVPVPANLFRLLSGHPTEYVKVSASGAHRVQAFCSSCGTALYGSSAGPEPKQIYVVRVGTLRERDQFRPTSQIWTRSAQPWTQTGLGGIRSCSMDSSS